MHLVWVGRSHGNQSRNCSPLLTLVESSTTPHTAMLVSMEPEAICCESGDQARAVTRER